MDNNQINGQKNNKEAYCPNPIFNNGNVSIGEFKTMAICERKCREASTPIIWK